jgi:hypothetical protein
MMALLFWEPYFQNFESRALALLLGPFYFENFKSRAWDGFGGIGISEISNLAPARFSALMVSLFSAFEGHGTAGTLRFLSRRPRMLRSFTRCFAALFGRHAGSTEFTA